MKQQTLNFNTANSSNQSQSRPGAQQLPAVPKDPFQQQIGQPEIREVERQKIISVTCECIVEVNGFVDPLIKNKEKEKILYVFKSKKVNQRTQKEEEDMRFQVRYLKSQEVAYEFFFKNIQQVFAQRASQGLATFLLKTEKEIEQTEISGLAFQIGRSGNLGRNVASNPKFKIEQDVKILLSKMEPELARALTKVYENELQRRTKPQQVSRQPDLLQSNFGAIQQIGQKVQNQQSNPRDTSLSQQMVMEGIIRPTEPYRSKKRKFLEISNPIVHQAQGMKAVRLNERGISSQALQQMQAPKPKLAFKIMPWDVIRIILAWTQRTDYKRVRLLSRDFAKLVNEKKLGLDFSKKHITERCFYSICKKSQTIKDFKLGVAALDCIPMTQLDKLQLQFRCLQSLNLLNFVNINEATLNRLIHGCTKTLKSIKLSYDCKGLSFGVFLTLSNCPSLIELQLGECSNNYKIMQYRDQAKQRLKDVKSMLSKRKFSLQAFTCYEVDQAMLELLASGGEPTTLVKIAFARFDQKDTKTVKELQILYKFKNVCNLNLTSGSFPLKFELRQQDLQSVDITGNRELELVFFNYKSNLKVLNLGAFAYNELIWYVSEICKNIEKLVINSKDVTDQGLLMVFKKMENLKFLDIAQTEFIGVSLYDAEDIKCQGLVKLVVALGELDFRVVNTFMQENLPACIVENQKKKP